MQLSSTKPDERPRLDIHLRSKPLFDEKKVERVWEPVQRFGATLDQFAIPLGENPPNWPSTSLASATR